MPDWTWGKGNRCSIKYNKSNELVHRNYSNLWGTPLEIDYRLLLPTHGFCKDLKFSFYFLILRFQVQVLLLTKCQVLFQCLPRKTNIHIIKYTNIPQPADSTTAACPCAAVIKNNTATVTWQSFNIVSILGRGVLSCSSHRFTVHHHIFRQPCEANCFICSEPHFLCHPLQVQLSYPVIQTVLEKTRSMLLLLQLLLQGSDLNCRHFAQDFFKQPGQDCAKRWPFSYIWDEFMLLLVYFDVLCPQLNAQFENFLSPEVKHLKPFRRILPKRMS